MKEHIAESTLAGWMRTMFVLFNIGVGMSKQDHKRVGLMVKGLAVTGITLAILGACMRVSEQEGGFGAQLRTIMGLGLASASACTLGFLAIKYN